MFILHDSENDKNEPANGLKNVFLWYQILGSALSLMFCVYQLRQLGHDSSNDVFQEKYKKRVFAVF